MLGISFISLIFALLKFKLHLTYLKNFSHNLLPTYARQLGDGDIKTLSNMKKKLQLIAAVVIVALSSVSAGAQCFNHLGANVQVGTTGITIEAATNITRFINVRAGVDILPGITFNTDADFSLSNPLTGQSEDGSISLKGDLGRVQGHVIFNIYPIPTASFFIAVGGYFGGDKLLKIDGHSDEIKEYIDRFPGAAVGGGVVIGDMVVPTNTNGDVKGGLSVKKFRPYFGLGWGRAVPNRRINFGVELGVQIQGKPTLYTEYGSLENSNIDDDNTIQDIIDKVTIYPVLSFKLGFRAF